MRRIMAWFGGVMPTGVSGGALGDAPARPTLLLSRAAPNPFGDRTTISYQLAAAAPVRLSLYNVMGQQVAVLASGPQRAGGHQATWDGRDRAGRPMPNGVYFIRLEAAGQGTVVQKAMLLR
jgi:hypothetical protein